MIQIETGMKRANMLTPSEFGLVTQAYYRSVGGRAKIDWRRLNDKFNQLRKFIERTSVGKVDGCLVMPSAYELVCNGGQLTESIREGFDRWGKKHVKLLSLNRKSGSISTVTKVRQNSTWTRADGWIPTIHVRRRCRNEVGYESESKVKRSGNRRWRSTTHTTTQSCPCGSDLIPNDSTLPLINAKGLVGGK